MTISYGGQDDALNEASSSDHITVPVPLPVAAGTFMVAHITVAVASAGLTAPDGWTPLGAVREDGNLTTAVYTRYATASEPADYTWTHTLTRSAGRILAYPGVSLTAAVADWSVVGTTTSTTSLATGPVDVPEGGWLLVLPADRRNAPSVAQSWGTDDVDDVKRGEVSGATGSNFQSSSAGIDSAGPDAGTGVTRTVTAAQTWGQAAVWVLALAPEPPPPPPPPRFPLQDRYELLLDGAWTDITPWVYERDPVTITRGRSAEAEYADPCTMGLTLDNRGGRFSARNPVGPWFGLIGRNTAIRASLPAPAAYLRLPVASDEPPLSCATSAALNVTDLDVRIDLDVDTWRDGNIAGKYGWPSDCSWFLDLSGDTVGLVWSPTGNDADRLVASSTAPIPTDRRRVALRATLDVDNGAGGWTATFYEADTIDGPWRQIGDPVTGAGVTTIAASTAALEVAGLDTILGFGPAGRLWAFELRDGIDGTLVAAPGIAGQAPGTTVFADAQGNTWTVANGAVLDDRDYRFHGEVSSWPATYSLDDVDDYVKIAASGVTRRLTQNPPAARSTMFREFANPARQNIVGYWPMEDGKEATQVASSGTALPARVTGSPTFADYEDWTASDPLPVMASGRFDATVPAVPGTGQLSIRMFVYMPSGGVSTTTSLLQVTTTGAAARWEIWLHPDGDLTIFAHDRESGTISGTNLGSEIAFDLDSRGFVILNLELSNNGSGGVDWRVVVLDFTNTDTIHSPIPNPEISGTIAGYNVGAARSVTVGRGRGLTGVVLGHLAVANDLDAYASTAAAIAAHNGEDPADRLARLCAEEDLGFALRTHGRTGNAVTMGDQLNKALIDLLKECADSDGGRLYEPREALGIAYRTRASLYNQAVAVTLDWNAEQVAGNLDPVDDDEGIANDITVQRIAGSSVRVEETTGRMSVQPPPDGVGRADAKADLSLESDDQLPDQAAWRLHLGTVDEARYPILAVNLRAPGLTDDQIEQIHTIDVGDRIVLTGLPNGGEAALIVEGYTETLRLMQHEIVFNCSPASPWEVAVVGDDERARIDTGGSQLAADATADATTLSVTTTDGPTWTLSDLDVPFDVLVAGERCTVTAVGTPLNANPYFTTDVSDWTTTAGVTLARSTTVVHPDAVASMEITPDGASTAGGAGAGLVPVTPSSRYAAMMWANAPAGYGDIRVLVNWHTADGTFISSSLGTQTALPAGEWTYLKDTFTAPPTAGQAAVWAWQASSPTASDVFYVWAVRLVPDDDPQPFTVTRAVNGVTKAQTSGADVRLVQPAIVAL